MTDIKLWDKLILMSATPHVPLVASANLAGIGTQVITTPQLRTAKRFIAWDPRRMKVERITPNTIIFCGKGLKDKSVKVA